MKRSFARLIQVALVITGLAALALLLWEPHIEGRNAHATIFEIYFHDPFLAYVYLGSTPFFVALYRAFGLFGHVRRQGKFSQTTVDALRAIKRCAIAVIGFVVGAAVFILAFGDGEDRPAGIFMSLFFILASSLVAIAAAGLARNLQKSLSRSEPSPI